jgi:hypothetical protein
MRKVDHVLNLMPTYDGVWSLEPFSSSVGLSPTLADDLPHSMEYNSIAVSQSRST